MKRVLLPYIPEKIIREAREDIIHFPSHINLFLDKHKTSLGKHPSFPPDGNIPFDKKITMERFEEVKKNVASINELNSFSENDCLSLIGKLSHECVSLETPLRNQLEKICGETVINLFSAVNDKIEFKCNLVDDVDHKASFKITPESNIDFNDVTEIEEINDEIYKRRLVDALIMGASIRLSQKAMKNYIGEVFLLNDRLPELYSTILKLNDYLLFVSDDIKISDRDNMQGGYVSVILGNETTPTKIESKALILPVLICESIKGFMELLASYGLPEEKNKALYVINEADFLLAEPWDMRIGPILWDYFMDACGGVDIKLIPYIFKALIQSSCGNFFKTMKEIFAKTKKGKQIMKAIIDKIQHDIDYTDFEKRIINKNKSVIEDEFFSPMELLASED